jgi:hypothetical protein
MELPMRKILIIVILISIMAGNSYAFTSCDKYTYSELKDMTKDELNKTYCLLKDQSDSVNMEMVTMKREGSESGHFQDGYKYLEECSLLIEKAYRVYKEKFNEEPINCKKFMKK